MARVEVELAIDDRRTALQPIRQVRFKINGEQRTAVTSDSAPVRQTLHALSLTDAIDSQGRRFRLLKIKTPRAGLGQRGVRKS